MKVWISFHILYFDTKSRSIFVLMHKPKARVNLDLAIIQHDKSYHLILLNRTDTEQGNHPANASTGKHPQFLVFGGLTKSSE